MWDNRNHGMALGCILTKRHILGGVLLLSLLLFAGVPARAAQSPGSGQDDTPPSAEDARALSYYHFTMGHHFEEMAGLSRRPDYITRAIEQFKLALQYAPGSHQIAVRLAEAYRRSGRIRDAVQEMQAVLEEDPDRLSAHRVLGRIYFQTLGDSPEHARGRATLGLAIEQYEHVVRLAPEATEDLLTLGRLYRFKNDFASAEETLGRLLDVDPGSEEGMSELAYIYLSRGEHQRAIDLLQGTAVETSSSELLARLAHAYQQKDDLDSAIQIFWSSRSRAPPPIGDRAPDRLHGGGVPKVGEGITECALYLFLGGRALAPECCTKTLGAGDGEPRVYVLD